MNRIVRGIVALSVVSVAGCAHPQKAPVVEETRAPAKPQLVMQAAPASEPPKDDSSAQVRDALNRSTVYFDFDLATLKPEGQSALQQAAWVLRKHPSVKIQISGNCDERGTSEYNMLLGQRRAETAKKYLTDLGVSADQLDTISYGAERPVAAGHDDQAWAQNRRDELSASK